MFGICNSIIRSNPDSKEKLLEYFSHIIKLNEKRAQMQVDIQTVASDGFMHNITGVLLTFCDPFLDVRASKINKIDPTYLLRSKRLDVSEDTKINATKEQSDAYYNEQRETIRKRKINIIETLLIFMSVLAQNFISECFFLTLSFLHYGPIRGLVNYNGFLREYNEVKKQTERAEQEATRSANVCVIDSWDISNYINHFYLYRHLKQCWLISYPRE
jgi:ubiquitin conjugation factor E4 B